MTAPCWWCEGSTELVRVGFIGSDSGPGRTIHACSTCQEEYRIVPLADHPLDTDGRPRYQPRPRQSSGRSVTP